MAFDSIIVLLILSARDSVLSVTFCIDRPFSYCRVGLSESVFFLSASFVAPAQMMCVAIRLQDVGSSMMLLLLMSIIVLLSKHIMLALNDSVLVVNVIRKVSSRGPDFLEV